MTSINLSRNDIVREFKTLDAARKYAAKLNHKTWIGAAKKSFFGFELNSKGYIFQIHLIEEEKI